MMAASQFADSPEDWESLLWESVALYRKLDGGLGFDAALNNLSVALLVHGKWDDAERLTREYLDLARSTGDLRDIAFGTGHLADLLAHIHGDLAAAADLAAESLDAARRSGSEQLIANSLSTVASVHRLTGDLDTAEQAAIEAEKIEEDLVAGGQYPGLALTDLALVSLERGDVDSAREQITRALQRISESVDGTELPGTAAWSLLVMASIESERRNHHQALTLIAAHDQWFEQQSIAWFPYFEAKHDGVLRQAEEALDPSDFERGWAKGTAMSLDEAVAYALDQPDD